MMRAMLPLGLLLLAIHPAQANPPVDETKSGGCLELKLDGRPTPCNHDFRFVDDGKGEISFVTGYGDGRAAPKTVLALFTAQTPDMENAYGYALRLTNVTLMTYDKPASQRMWKAAGLCFLVKPNPVRAGAKAVRQDIVVMCSATLADAGVPVRRVDWKFAF
ncbi:hypothetical protein [Methylobacterium soli]|uniref:Uncharacterized protein n=1 Tax=Methylobacterium soli TaxID=553447 RepID=A0A6L3T070_9HYPH|nr:hypothetical protein [Methylobacterium soli]KAB1077909.1 hypothetical protein F6X53_17040 [Methylobacterium soli]GJE41588.1 hypothetical protein AEGHOMDF_0754 [Methylobacterium soli]